MKNLFFGFSLVLLPIIVVIYYALSNVAAGILLMIMAVLMAVLMWKKTGKVLNYLGAFSFIWLFTVGLSVLRIHPKQVEWQVVTWVCLLGAYYMFLLGYKVLDWHRKFTKKKNKSGKLVDGVEKVRAKFGLEEKGEIISKKRFMKFLVTLTLIPVAALIIETLINGGRLPLFSDDMSSYQDFGVGLLHYFTVATCLVPMAGCLAWNCYDLSKKEKIMVLVLDAISMLVPVLIVSRQLLIVSVVSFMLVYCVLRPKKEIKALVLSAILVICGWVAISGFRNQDDAYLKNALQMGPDPVLSVPSMQAYMYVAMNYDNFDLNIKSYDDYKYGLASFRPVAGLLRVGNVISNEDLVLNLKKIVPVYNTYPVVMTPYVDGGVFFVLIYMFLIGILCRFVETLNLKKPFNMLLYGIIGVCLIFTFFSDWFAGRTWWFYVIYLAILCLLFFGNSMMERKRDV